MGASRSATVRCVAFPFASVERTLSRSVSPGRCRLTASPSTANPLIGCSLTASRKSPCFYPAFSASGSVLVILAMGPRWSVLSKEDGSRAGSAPSTNPNAKYANRDKKRPPPTNKTVSATYGANARLARCEEGFTQYSKIELDFTLFCVDQNGVIPGRGHAPE